MDLNSVISTIVANNAQMNGDAVAISVLKKANQLQGQSALALLEAAVQNAPQPLAVDGNLGRHIDVLA